MIKADDLKDMSFQELKDLRKEIDTAIVTAERDAKEEAIKAVAEAAASRGFSLNDLLGGKTKKRKEPKPVKYVDPTNPSNTWTGRGRRPQWFMAAVEAGTSPDDMEV